MAENILVILIVLGCFLWLGRRVYRQIKGGSRSGCGCGCSGCGPQERSTCGLEEKSDNQ